jgi:CHASE2 domain-containing sensor protein
VRELDDQPNSRLRRSALGAALAIACGLLLWKTDLFEGWVNASYDYSFRYGARSPTNHLTLIVMDKDAYDHFQQDRGQRWDRALHAQLLQRLAADGCPLVVFDSFFDGPTDPAKDTALEEALSRQRRVVLLADQAEVSHPGVASARPTLPFQPFLSAAGTNWGVGWLCPDLDGIVRRHWPFPSPGIYPSLPEAAAHMAGASLNPDVCEKWLRYYGSEGPWDRLGYRYALDQPANYYSNRIVFIGKRLTNPSPDAEPDQFRTSYTRWTGETTGGVEIMATAFLNLMNREWLQRPPWWIEALTLMAAGALFGGTLCQVRPLPALGLAAAAALVVAMAAVAGTHFTNYWFPWLVVSGGQVPCALSFALATHLIVRKPAAQPSTSLVPAAEADDRPDTPDYELFSPPFGRGTYGKVWLARNAVGQYQALKVVYLSRFKDNPRPYDREFNGVTHYKPISDKHPGLLRVDFVSKKRADYFYYVMELGDPIQPGWEKEPSTYRPRDLFSLRSQGKGARMPLRECLRIGVLLSDALAFLHQQGLTHRDIKPQNIIFVNGQPKLADVGLVAEIRPPEETGTYVGTPGYMPLPPEHPGTAQADIYSLGMVLYVLSTGQDPALFPVIPTSLADSAELAPFFPLNNVITKACHPDRAQRYASAWEMHTDLKEAQKAVERLI